MMMSYVFFKNKRGKRKRERKKSEFFFPCLFFFDLSAENLSLSLSQPPSSLNNPPYLVARRGDEDVGGLEAVLQRRDGVPFHRRLQSADRVDLGDDDARAGGLHRRGRPLADVAEAGDEGLLARDHHVGRAHDAVGQGVAAPVHVVELGFRHRVVDVDGREQQGPRLLHLVQALDARGRLLGHAHHALGHAGPLVGVLGEAVLDDLEHDLELGVVGGGRVRERAVLLEGGLGLDALVDEQRRVAAVVDEQVGALAVLPRQHLLGAPPVLLERLALPGEDRGRVAGDGGGGVVLRREDVARAPADVGAERGQRLDQDGGLDRHVQRAGDARALEGLRAAELGAAGHEAGHLGLGEVDLEAAKVGLGDVLDLVLLFSVFVFFLVRLFEVELFDLLVGKGEGEGVSEEEKGK